MATAFNIVKDSRRELAEKIIENMKKGYVWTPHPWSSAALRPYNPASDCYYLGGNRMRLMYAAIENDYKDPRWCTYKQAEHNGWQVRRGAQSVLLEKWIFTESKIQENETGQPERVEIKLERPKVNYFRVFNAEQIHGIPKFEPVVTTDTALEKITDQLIASSKCTIQESMDPRAYYDPIRDRINLPLRSSFRNSETFLSVAAHEMAHSTGHESRLSRPFCGKFGTPEYALEELRAEISSAFLKSDLQVSLSPEQLQGHSNYLQSWISVLENDPNELFRACKDAERISDYLYQNYEHAQEYSISTELYTELQKNGFSPTDTLVKNISKLQEYTGKNYTLQEIAQMSKKLPENPVCRQLLQDISQECCQQELTIHAAAKAMETQLLNEPVL